MKHPYQILFAVLGALPLFCVAADAVQTPVASTNQVAAASAVAAPVAKAEAPAPEAKAPAMNAVAKAPEVKAPATNAVAKAEAQVSEAKEPVTNVVAKKAEALSEAKAPTTNAVAETSAKAPAVREAGATNAVAQAAVKADAKDEDDDEADTSSGTNSVPTAAEKPEDPRFARYKTILDRMPFGPEPPGFVDIPGGGSGAYGTPGGQNGIGTDEVPPDVQAMLSGVRISALNVTPRGSIAVGFTDSSKQPAATYYMKVGETRDGWTIKSADPHEMTVTLERDGVEGTLKLGEGADPNAKGGKGGAGRPGQPNAMANRGMMGMRGGLPNGGGFGGRPSWGGGRGGFGGMRGGMPMAGANPDGAAAAAPNETAGDALARLRQRRLQKEAERQAESARQAAAAEQAKAEREKAAADREKAAAEREQQRQTLIQIQEELRRQREAREQQQQQQNETGAGAAPAPAPVATPPEA
ncbi:MAG: hypothetical protein MJ249_14270 [Kiritimatiellae bacterium]|nr:hypothetical protein [Kiritimatiellia bacterium]